MGRRLVGAALAHEAFDLAKLGQRLVRVALTGPGQAAQAARFQHLIRELGIGAESLDCTRGSGNHAVVILLTRIQGTRQQQFKVRALARACVVGQRGQQRVDARQGGLIVATRKHRLYRAQLRRRLRGQARCGTEHDQTDQAEESKSMESAVQHAGTCVVCIQDNANPCHEMWRVCRIDALLSRHSRRAPASHPLPLRFRSAPSAPIESP